MESNAGGSDMDCGDEDDDSSGGGTQVEDPPEGGVGGVDVGDSARGAARSQSSDEVMETPPPSGTAQGTFHLCCGGCCLLLLLLLLLCPHVIYIYIFFCFFGLRGSISSRPFPTIDATFFFLLFFLCVERKLVKFLVCRSKVPRIRTWYEVSYK